MVEQFAYTVRGWGTGELVLADGIVAWHELPVATSSPRREHALVDRVRSYFRGSRDTFGRGNCFHV